MSSRDSSSYYVVDVFSDRPFMGNPAAVVICDPSLSARKMQQAAAWINLSETVFVTGYEESTGRFKVRMFSPGGEMPFAGHPTLGTAAAVRRHYRATGSDLVQDCPAGLVPIRFDDRNRSVHLISPNPKAEPILDSDLSPLAAALGLNEPILGAAKIDAGPVWATVLIQSPAAIAELQPNQKLIREWSDRLSATGVVVGAASPDGLECKLRTFAPSVGVAEDPVCGSGNVALAYLRAQIGDVPRTYLARQGQELGRDGEIAITYMESGKIELGGRTHITASGRISLPD